MMAELDILNGFAGKVISDCIDITVEAIKKADKNRKSANQTMETRIYQVTIDVLNEFPYNKYKKEEKVYDAAECILKQLKNKRTDYEKVIEAGLKMICSQYTNEICNEFLGRLCEKICINKNDILYKEVVLRSLGDIRGDMYQIQGDVNYLKGNIDYIKEKVDSKEKYKKEHFIGEPIENKAQYYADKWDKNVFLNNFDEEDERAGDRVNVKLKDIYLEELLPPYILNKNQNISYNLKTRLEKYIVNKNDREMLLILGQPGIGKSTLITWIMANLVEKNDEIFVYQFASDLKKVNWQGEDILEEIFKALRLGDEELKNKVLILDGFDEINISGDRERILNNLNHEVDKMEHLGKFSLIITCRENYVNQSRLSLKTYITLQAWNKEQIKSFCEIYREKSMGENVEIKRNKISEIKILEKKEIFGIPLVLYMVLALNVDIEKSSSMVDIYDQIFSLERGSIYDRCYDVEHRINSPEIKKHIHRITQKIAFWIFENNADKAFIPQEKFIEICNNEMNELGQNGKDIQSDVLIGNYFAPIKHCEGVGTCELQFVHRSIYEYFVVVYFFETIYSLKSREKIAGKLGKLLKEGRLTEQILEFIKCKFNSLKRNNLSDFTIEIFNMMLHDGMIYYTKERYKNIVEKEMNIFLNMLKVVHLWNCELGELDDKVIYFLRYNNYPALNLVGIKLRNVNLRGADFRRAYFMLADLSYADLGEVNLCGANLCGANLNGANLNGANLKGANLRGADLRKTNLREVDLREADLRGADLNEADLNGANMQETIFDKMQIRLLHKRYDLSNGRVYHSKTKETISYKEYCVRKEQE